ncbi:MAG: NlpC/P60 family protein [Waterburya sp.]
MDSQDLIVSNARDWLGTPWRHNQRAKGVGVDCVQFAIASVEALGVDVGSQFNYYRIPQGNSLKDYLDRLPNLRITSEISKGNLLLFRIAGVPHHIAIATSPTTMIHASNNLGVVEHSIGAWMRKISAIYEVIV